MSDFDVQFLVEKYEGRISMFNPDVGRNGEIHVAVHEDGVVLTFVGSTPFDPPHHTSSFSLERTNGDRHTLQVRSDAADGEYEFKFSPDAAKHRVGVEGESGGRPTLMGIGHATRDETEFWPEQTFRREGRDRVRVKLDLISPLEEVRVQVIRDQDPPDAPFDNDGTPFEIDGVTQVTNLRILVVPVKEPGGGGHGDILIED